MKKYLLTTIIMMVTLLTANTLQAQDQQQTITWKGSDYTTLLSGSGTEVFLYNVGTGRFMIHGGDWGTQARLFYNDTGKTLTLQYGAQRTNIIFETGMSTGGSSALGCNIPGLTSAHGWDAGAETYTVLMDGAEQIGNGSATDTYRNWHFTRVEDAGNTDTYTYYMYEVFSDSTVYMGAGYGESWGNHEGNPNGKLVFLGADRPVWTTMVPGTTDTCVNGVWSAADEGLPEGTTTVERGMETEVPIFNVDTKVKLKELYQWRIVTKEQLMASMTNTDVNDGLATNLTYLIYDRGFERNDWSFFTYWTPNRFSDVTYTTSGEGRYKYTWGYLTGNASSKTNNQSGTRTVTGQNYMYPVRLKSQWDSKSDAKFGYLEFEGVGTVSTYIEAPADGVYEISGYGFYQGPHEGYLFATTTDPASSGFSTSSITNKADFIQVYDFDKSIEGTATATSQTGVKGAGYDFVYNKGPYYVKVEIHATAGQKIYFGVGKNDATKSSRDSGNSSSTQYFHDTDWVGADQFQIRYLGTDYAKLLDEDKSVDFSDESYIGATGTDETGQTTGVYVNRALRLHRTFQTGKWNSIVLPIDMTALQVRNAFGDGTRVAKLEGLGTRSKNAKILDFVTVALPAEGAAIEKGKFYLIMPENEPATGTDYYELGAYTFSGTTLDAAKIAEDVFTPAEGAANPTEASVMTKGTYKSTPGYEYENGNKFGESEEKVEGTYIPARSYVIGAQGENTTIFHTVSDLKTKGFRAWLVDVEGETTQNTISSVAINGIADITAIDEVLADELKAKPTNGAIYDISGRKVGEISDLNSQSFTLSKGIYIVNGKKVVIK
ncbi:MAG: hypothetical protein IJK21_09050 [Prevotella sp.]|nr:hypothetical protein [Prevotella sp.]